MQGRWRALKAYCRRCAFQNPSSARFLKPNFGHHLRYQLVAPAFARSKYAFGRTQVVVVRAQSEWIFVPLDRIRRFQQQSARHRDRLVGGPQMLFRAVDDRPHAFLNGSVLGIDSVDSCEGLGPLHVAVDHPVIRTVVDGLESVLVVNVDPVGVAALDLILNRLLSVGREEVPDHAAVVVDGHPVVAVSFLFAGPRRAGLSKRHDEVGSAYVDRPSFESANAEVSVAVFSYVDFQTGRGPFDTDVVGRYARLERILFQSAVQYREVRGVDAAFEGLQPIARLRNFAYDPVAVG